MKEVTMYQTTDGKIFASRLEAKAHEDEIAPEKEWDIELCYEGTFATTVYAKTREEAIEKARDRAEYEDIYYEEVEVYASVVGE